MHQILLVEDNPVNARLICRQLERQGYAITVAEEGKTAIALAQTEPPHLILMDIGLPDMEGWEIAQRLRQDSQTAAIPIIALTAHHEPAERQRCLAAGCNDYATKPIDFPELLAKIQQYLSIPR